MRTRPRLPIVAGFLVTSLIAAGCVYAQQSFNRSFGPERFGAPNVNQESTDFTKRTERELFNVDFITANVIGKANKIAREVTASSEKTANFVTDQVIRNQEGSAGGPVAAGSVIVQPGVNVNDLFIVNIIEGDAIAIER